MKPKKKIMKEPEILTLLDQDEMGGMSFRIKLPRWTGTAIASTGFGWDHVSVAPHNRNIMPSWNDMCRIKDIFFYPGEVAIQYHPEEGKNVNILQNCLHLWRPNEEELPVPPLYLV